MTTEPIPELSIPAEPLPADLSALSLTELLQVGRVQQDRLPKLTNVRLPEADPDLEALKRELDLIIPLRRSLAQRLLETLGVQDNTTPEAQALYLLMTLCREEGLRNGRMHAALRQAWLTRMAQLTTLTPKPGPDGEIPGGPAATTRNGWKLQREQLERRIEKLRAQVESLEAQETSLTVSQPVRREKHVPKLSSKENAARQAELLAALRGRDEAIAAQDRLEERLSRVVELYGDDVLARRLGAPGERERERLLTHFRRRLKERFELSLSYAEVSALDRQHRLMPITHRTPRGTAVKLLKISGNSVYAVVTPDRAGDLTLTTVYTAVMLDQIGGF